MIEMMVGVSVRLSEQLTKPPIIPKLSVIYEMQIRRGVTSCLIMTIGSNYLDIKASEGSG